MKINALSSEISALTIGNKVVDLINQTEEGAFLRKARTEYSTAHLTEIESALSCLDEKIRAISFHLLESHEDEYKHVVSDPKSQSKRKILVHTALMDKKNLKITHVFTAHLNFYHSDWREMGAKVVHQIAQQVLEKEKQKLQGKEQAAVLMGDQNTFDNRPEMKLPAFDGNRVLKIMKGSEFVGAREEALWGYFGPLSKFTNDPKTDQQTGGYAAFKGYGNPGIFLDHILVSKESVTPLIHGVNEIGVGETLECPSDHMPIVADILVN